MSEKFRHELEQCLLLKRIESKRRWTLKLGNCYNIFCTFDYEKKEHFVIFGYRDILEDGLWHYTPVDMFRYGYRKPEVA